MYGGWKSSFVMFGGKFNAFSLFLFFFPSGSALQSPVLASENAKPLFTASEKRWATRD